MIPAAHDAPSQASSRRVLPPRLRFRSARWIEQRSVDNGSTYAIARTFEAQRGLHREVDVVSLDDKRVQPPPEFYPRLEQAWLKRIRRAVSGEQIPAVVPPIDHVPTGSTKLEAQFPRHGEMPEHHPTGVKNSPMNPLNGPGSYQAPELSGVRLLGFFLHSREHRPTHERQDRRQRIQSPNQARKQILGRIVHREESPRSQKNDREHLYE